MDDYTDEVAPEATETEQPEPSFDENHPRYKQLRQENQSLRQRLRRTELEANFGKEIVELVPEELPLDKWEEFAGRLAERLSKPEAPEAGQETPPEPAPQEDVRTDVGTVTGAPAPGTQAAGELMTVAQIKELAKTDPVTANQLISQGKYQKQTTW